jgi:hypothetical protein
MKPLPMPIRIAAGLVVTALEEMQELPRKITELPVTAVSQALQASMRLQQRVTELAIKGDRALGALRPVPETPTWARFDEDDEDQEPRHNGLRQEHDAVDAPRPPKVTPVRILPYPAPEGDDEAEPEVSELPVPRSPVESPTVPGRRESGPDATVEKLAAEVSPATDATLTESARPTDQAAPETEPETEPPPAARKRSANKTTTSKNAGSRRKADAPDDKKADPGQDGAGDTKDQGKGGPPGLPEYENWTLPQLRGRFRALSLEQLQQLLDWETSHRDRPAYVTMLSNRIASVTGR